MAQLQSIISSVLRDVLVAQHEANIYSMSLCESYRKDGHTELFPLPAIAIGEMELEIRYGIKAVAAQSIQFEINYPLLRKTVRKLTAQLAKVMLESIINSILSSPLAADKERIKLIEQLSAQTEINRKFSSFLDQKLQDSVIGQFTNLLKDDGGINSKVLRSCVMQTGNEELLYHPELINLFEGAEGQKLTNLYGFGKEYGGYYSPVDKRSEFQTETYFPLRRCDGSGRRTGQTSRRVHTELPFQSDTPEYAVESDGCRGR